MNRSVEDLFDLTRHHGVEPVGLDDPQIDRRLAEALPGLGAHLDDLLELFARDDAEAIERLAEALLGDGRGRVDDGTVLEVERARPDLREHDQLTGPLGLRRQ